MNKYDELVVSIKKVISKINKKINNIDNRKQEYVIKLEKEQNKYQRLSNEQQIILRKMDYIANKKTYIIKFMKDAIPVYLIYIFCIIFSFVLNTRLLYEYMDPLIISSLLLSPIIITIIINNHELIELIKAYKYEKYEILEYTYNNLLAQKIEISNNKKELRKKIDDLETEKNILLKELNIYNQCLEEASKVLNDDLLKAIHNHELDDVLDKLYIENNVRERILNKSK